MHAVFYSPVGKPLPGVPDLQPGALSFPSLVAAQCRRWHLGEDFMWICSLHLCLLEMEMQFTCSRAPLPLGYRSVSSDSHQQGCDHLKALGGPRSSVTPKALRLEQRSAPADLPVLECHRKGAVSECFSHTGGAAGTYPGYLAHQGLFWLLWRRGPLWRGSGLHAFIVLLLIGLCRLVGCLLVSPGRTPRRAAVQSVGPDVPAFPGVAPVCASRWLMTWSTLWSLIFHPVFSLLK